MKSTLLGRVEAVTEQIHVCRLSGSALAPVLACGAVAVRSRVFLNRAVLSGGGNVRGCRPGQSYNQHLFEPLSGVRFNKKHTQAFSEGRDMKAEFYFMLAELLQLQEEPPHPPTPTGLQVQISPVWTCRPPSVQMHYPRTFTEESQCSPLVFS